MSGLVTFVLGLVFLNVWAHIWMSIWVSVLVLWVSGLVFWVSGLAFLRLYLYCWCLSWHFHGLGFVFDSCTYMLEAVLLQVAAIMCGSASI